MAKTTTLQKIIAEAKRIQKVHTHMSWKEAIKDASKHIKEGAKTVVKKPASKKTVGALNLVHVYDTDGSLYGTGTVIKKDGNKVIVRFDGDTIKEFKLNQVKPINGNGIEALPVNFVGSFWGFKFKIVNQYRLDGGVTAQIFEAEAPAALIGELTGFKQEIDRVVESLYNGALYTVKADKENYNYSLQNDPREEKKLKDKIKRFVTLLSDDVKAYNTGKDKNIIVSKPTVKELAAGITPKVVRKKEFKVKVSTSKAGVVDQIKSVLKANHKILTHGYKIKSGKVREKKVGVGHASIEDLVEDWREEGRKMVAKQLAYYESERYLANTKLEQNKLARKIHDLKKIFNKFKK